MEASFMLPLGGAASGAAGVPLEGCVPPSGTPGDGRRLPRCTLTFEQPVTFVAATPDGAMALVAVVNTGVSAWDTPGGRFRLGLAPPPPVVGPREALPHAEAANAVAISPSRREAVVAFENRLLVYSTATGGVIRELPPLRGVVRDLAWSPDGTKLLVTLLYDPAAHVLQARDGLQVSLLPVEREGAAVAFASDGRLAAVGSEVGPIVLFASRSPGTAVWGLAWAGPELVSGDGQGRVALWDFSDRLGQR